MIWFRGVLLLSAFIFACFGFMGLREEMMRESKLNQPFRNFAFNNPQFAVRRQQQIDWERMTEQQKYQATIAYWKQKYSEIKEQSKISFIRGGL